jgi:hypothetical protein
MDVSRATERVTRESRSIGLNTSSNTAPTVRAMLSRKHVGEEASGERSMSDVLIRPMVVSALTVAAVDLER